MSCCYMIISETLPVLAAQSISERSQLRWLWRTVDSGLFYGLFYPGVKTFEQ